MTKQRRQHGKKHRDGGALVEPPEFLALLERARRSDGPSAPRKHHLVPNSYLCRWAEDGLVRVTEVNTRKTYPSSPGKAARETDYHRIDSEEIDPEAVPPLLFETMLSLAEGQGKQAIDELLIKQPWEINPELLAWFTWYLGYQHTRGHTFRQEHRHAINNTFKLMWGGITDTGIRTHLKESGKAGTDEEVRQLRHAIDDLKNDRIVVSPQDAMTIGHAGELAEKAGAHLLAREWIVYQTPPILITCDEPVVVIGGPGLPRDERAGIGAAGVIAFPLAPHAVLVMFRRDIAPPRMPDQLDHLETAELNHEILVNAARWAFERPSRKISTRLQVPPAPEPTKQEGPFEEVGGRGGQLFRQYRPNRWSNSEHPPDWPVARWWG